MHNKGHTDMRVLCYASMSSSFVVVGC